MDDESIALQIDMKLSLRTRISNAMRSLLNSLEQATFERLTAMRCGEQRVEVYPKVRLIDALDTLDLKLSNRIQPLLTHFERNKLYTAHVDFLIQRVDTNYAIVLEADGPGHRLGDQIQDDNAKAAVLKAYGMPLIRIDASALQPLYKATDLDERIVEALVKYALFHDDFNGSMFRPSWCMWKPKQTTEDILRGFESLRWHNQIGKFCRIYTPFPSDGIPTVTYVCDLPSGGAIIGSGRCYSDGIDGVASEMLAHEIAANEIRGKFWAAGASQPKDERSEAQRIEYTFGQQMTPLVVHDFGPVDPTNPS